MKLMLVFLASSFSFVAAVVLECSFIASPPTQPFPAVYECKGTFNSSENPGQLEKVDGIHEVRKGNFDVQSLSIMNDDKLEGIPRTVGSFCPNLKSFTWEDSNLRALSGDDFRHLAKLKFVSVAGNKIESLESDVFMHAPRLEVIKLNRNLIAHLERELLEDLGDLKSIDFTDNLCINGKASTDDEFNQLKSLFSGCPPLRLSARELCTQRKEIEAKLRKIDRLIAEAGDETCDDF